MTPVYASIDLGGTKTACALATAEGRILAERSIPTLSNQGPAAVLARIAAVLREEAEEAGANPVAAGMGIPGLVDRCRGVTLFLPNLPTQWLGIPVARVLAKCIGCPVYLLNDVRIATLGEMTFGLGREGRTMVFLSLGTGIGGGWSSTANSVSAHWGRPANSDTRPSCRTGLYAVAATTAVWKRWPGPAIGAEGVRLLRSGLAPRLHDLVGGNAEEVTPRQMAAAAEAGDEAVREVIVCAGGYLGIGIANVVNAIHPDLVVLGGGVAAMGGVLLDAVRAAVRRRVRMFPVDGVRIEPSDLADRAGIYGGIALAVRAENCKTT